MATAILVDGAFFLRRFRYAFPNHDRANPKVVAECLGRMVHWHLCHRLGYNSPGELNAMHSPLAESSDFYRLFFYDCVPLTKRVHTPLGNKSTDFGKSPQAVFRLALHSEIKSLRKVALRLGRLNETSRWRLSEEATARLISQPQAFAPTDADFEIDTKQKGVDMRMGLDVASLAFKRQVDQIVMVAADGDFVPAVKLARREGIDVVLDHMGDPRTANDLVEHSDGVRNCCLPLTESA